MCLLSVNVLAQEKVYEISQMKVNADINYKIFNTFGDIENQDINRLFKAFEAIKGSFTTYTFISEYMGNSFDGTEKLFHDYLILKVDPETDKIIDGYHFTMEWAEPPPISDLYRLTEKGLELKDAMNIYELEFELVDSDYKTKSRLKLNEKGVIKL